MGRPAYNELFFSRVTDYLNVYLEKNLSRSVHTVGSYRDALSIFRRYLNKEHNISVTKFKIIDVTVELLLGYRDYLKKDYENSTINHRISVIKSYLKYISECDVTYLSIYLKIQEIPPLKVPQRIKPILDDDALKAIIEEASKYSKGLRNRVMVILLYDMALRISELVNIRLDDIFFDDVKLPYVHITGKGDKDRLIVLSDRACEHLKYYLDVYHKGENCEYLFYTCVKGRYDRISVSAVEKLMDRITRNLMSQGADIPASIHPHMFRRSRSTHLYQDGVPLEQIARVLGHSSIETTKIYAQMSKEQMKKILQKKGDENEEPEWCEEDETAKMFGLR